MTVEVGPERKGTRLRRWLALALSPLVLVPLFILGSWGHMQIEGYAEKFWSEELRFYLGMTYGGSAMAGGLVRAIMKRAHISPSILRVTGGFILASVVLGAIGLALGTPKTPEVGILAIFIAIPAGIVALTYGLAAGLPWRAGES